MKGKKFTYLLICLVAIVWGLIIYRVFDSLKQKDDDITYQEPPPAKKSFDDYSVGRDSIRLSLNYRDPFGILVPRDTSIAKVQKKQLKNYKFSCVKKHY